MRVLNAAQMREADKRTIEEIGIPSLVLMENAGRQAVAAMEAMYSDLLERQIGVLCGRGNNGGDGFVIARTLVQPPGELRAGDIVIAAIGIPNEVLDGLDGPRVELLTRGSMRELVTPRSPDSHKGDYGRVLLVAGSRGKTGAAHLAAVGALRSGAGLVTVATPSTVQSVIAAMAPEYMTEPLGETDDGLDPEGVDHVPELARDV